MKFNMLNLILKGSIWFLLVAIEPYVFGLEFVEFYFVFFSSLIRIYTKAHLFDYELFPYSKINIPTLKKYNIDFSVLSSAYSNAPYIADG